MSGQEEHHASDASTKNQTRFAILTPASDNFVNPSDGTSSGLKKRKRDGNTMEDLLKDNFVVKPYPSAVSGKTRTLQPLMLLPRSQLPLSSLDIVSSAKILGQSRFFETHVKILELEDRMGSQPMVLIARLDDARTLCAVERESRGLYALCQLGSWVNLQSLKVEAVVSKQEMPKPPEKGTIGSAIPQAAIALATPESSKYSKKKRLAIEAIQSMVKRPPPSLVTDYQESPTEPELSTTPQAVKESTVLPPQEEVTTQLTAAEIFENVRNQYFEALYLSKASLAYFAKGPLSRARAAFHLDYDSTLDLNDYIAFLESLVMSTTLIDKKYRDGLSNCIAFIDIQDHSAEDATQASGKTKKKKSSKKMKPGKTGLYPTEDALIRRWWTSHDDDAESGAPGSSRDELTKRRISQLRIRETQLQMIVILEVLALQPLASTTEDIGMGLPAALPASEVAEAKDKSVKVKKPDHMTMLIDVHIDRLCIWQSIALEAGKGSANNSEKSSEQTDGTTSGVKHADNILKDFCIEIIAPFFSSRLPERCAIINRKLGGPVVVSPPKPKLSKTASFPSAPSRPGAATKRPVPVKPRRSLQRVLTDDRERRSMSRGPNKAIALMRSATMPTIPSVKREASEAPSLSSIPTADLQSLETHRGGVLKSKRFFQREVDLSNLATEASGNTKAKRQAIIEAELKDAISALKKPNRELAGKLQVDTAEKRAASTSHARKSKKPIRNPLFQGVQISATPKANRRKDMAPESLPSSLAKSIEGSGSAVIPVSSLPRIPQSALRPSYEGILKNNPLYSAIEATPTRKAATGSCQRGGFLSAPEHDYNAYLPSSPLHVRRSSAQLFTNVPDSTVKRVSTASSYGVQETPVKRRQEIMFDHGHPGLFGAGNDKENDIIERKKTLMATSSQEMGRTEENIYKSLGWDDDADDIDDLA
ncbi:hypothetical protein N431DRAFT_480052 [Stipitochalara longipes BDJ]|nr:hypothetical protein N431DRAFT_480052 [Stipitochalara longipes BDJ]